MSYRPDILSFTKDIVQSKCLYCAYLQFATIENARLQDTVCMNGPILFNAATCIKILVKLYVWPVLYGKP